MKKETHNVICSIGARKVTIEVKKIGKCSREDTMEVLCLYLSYLNPYSRDVISWSIRYSWSVFLNYKMEIYFLFFFSFLRRNIVNLY